MPRRISTTFLPLFIPISFDFLPFTPTDFLTLLALSCFIATGITLNYILHITTPIVTNRILLITSVSLIFLILIVSTCYMWWVTRGLRMKVRVAGGTRWTWRWGNARWEGRFGVTGGVMPGVGQGCGGDVEAAAAGGSAAGGTNEYQELVDFTTVFLQGRVKTGFN